MKRTTSTRKRGRQGSARVGVGVKDSSVTWEENRRALRKGVGEKKKSTLCMRRSTCSTAQASWSSLHTKAVQGTGLSSLFLSFFFVSCNACVCLCVCLCVCAWLLLSLFFFFLSFCSFFLPYVSPFFFFSIALLFAVTVIVIIICCFLIVFFFLAGGGVLLPLEDVIRCLTPFDVP